MAQFLRTAGVSHHLEEIIREADEFLLLISPYLSVSSRIQNDIRNKCGESQAIVNIIYRHEKQSSDIESWLASIPNVFAAFCETLHAKCYMNEQEALITSMNLLEYSQVNNYEMGVLVSLDNDFELYRHIDEGASDIVRNSKIVYEPEWNKDARLKREQRRELADDILPGMLPKLGFCLRCGTEIPCDVERPYCDSHYRIWARFKNENYEEKHCHIYLRDGP